MTKNALIIGNSDGIGLALTRELLKGDWKIVGVSRSESPVDHPAYQHHVVRVQDNNYPALLSSIQRMHAPIDLCVYCAGIGELLNLSDMQKETEIFEVNLVGLIKTVSTIVPEMVKNGSGHLVGLSSVADELFSPEAPSYHASKAGFSNYLKGLALAVRKNNVHITTLRFGFVDTKMAKGDVKPFMMTIDRAVRHVLRCIENKPVCYTAPRIVIPLLSLRKWSMNWQIRSFRH